jgi:hypothetical protein
MASAVGPQRSSPAGASRVGLTLPCAVLLPVHRRDQWPGNVTSRWGDRASGCAAVFVDQSAQDVGALYHPTLTGGGVTDGRCGFVRLQDGRVQITVSDDGSGIPPADLERVFHGFTRLDDARASSDGGAGLGVAIVAELVRRHGGTVCLGDAEPGLRVDVLLQQAPEEP